MDLVVTLVERDFLYGATALLNSLSRNGFQGTYIIGIRNESSLPRKLLIKLKEDPLINKGIRTQFLCADPPLHYANHKPNFMLECLKKYPDANRILYLDPDIVMTCPWLFVQNWIDSGIALCADVNHWMPHSHPIRQQWKEIISKEALSVQHALDLYFNSGMLGASSDNTEFIQTWARLIKNWGAESNPTDGTGNIGNWRKGGRWNRMYSPDQDTLNIAAMIWPKSLVTSGPDAMGFKHGDLFFPHAIGGSKPWNKNFLLHALRGFPPTLADKRFLSFCDSPIQIFPKPVLMRKTLLIRLMSFVGRFYKRNH